MYDKDTKQQKQLNFQLEKHGLRVKKTRGLKRIKEMGDCYMYDFYRNNTVDTFIDIHTFSFKKWFHIWWE
jgi:hypothetical protein